MAFTVERIPNEPILLLTISKPDRGQGLSRH